MYIEIVRQVVETHVSTYANDKDLAEAQVLRQIRGHINRMSNEYFGDGDPNIDYKDVLCRLGYLYRYAPAHANLFEHVLDASDEFSVRRLYADQWVLNIVAVGGGPGTELLGIAKHLARRARWMPRRVDFTVLDKVHQWSSLWKQIADVVEAHVYSSLRENEVQPPVFAPSFLPFDVFNEEYYESHEYQFKQADIVVFNYIFSENKSRLQEAPSAVKRLLEFTPPGCVFVVIDRLENDQEFQDAVVAVFKSVFGDDVEIDTYDRALDPDEEISDMGEELMKYLGKPVTSFHTTVKREPTVFWLAAKREEKVNGQ